MNPTMKRSPSPVSKAPARGPVGLISRVADCCFWFGRYLERAESVARQLEAHLNLALDGELTPHQCWHPLIVVAGEEANFRHLHGEEGVEDGDMVERYLVWDERCWVSLSRSVQAARENARAVREVLSGDVWETVNALHLFLEGAGRMRFEQDRDGFYRQVRHWTQLALGLMRSTMLQDTALDFIWLGVMLERTNQTARLLDVHHHALGPAEARPVHQVVETAMWLALLRACSGLEPFLKSNAGRVSPEAVARFLVKDARFPRSITYGVHAAYDRLAALRPPDDEGLPGGESLAKLEALELWVVSQPETMELHALLTRVVDDTADVAATLGRELLGYGVD
jgi:uncharacterized alpha-E superfamily protein